MGHGCQHAADGRRRGHPCLLAGLSLPAVVEPPEVRYARNGDVHIAYQVLGEGPFEIVHVAGFLTHLLREWDDPHYRRYCERLASFARLVLFDKRGMGMSDRVAIGTLEERMEDMTAVLDAIGSRSAALIGVSEGGPMSMVFAAAHPERTRALILCGAEVCECKTTDWPLGEATPEEFEARIESRIAEWGRLDLIPRIMPSQAGDAELRRVWQRKLAESASPGAALAFMRMAYDVDVRSVAATIHTPTLVLHAKDDAVCDAGNGRWLAEHIAGSRYVELPGADHLPWGENLDLIAGEVEELLTGTRTPAEPDRVLATVLFTDVVGSTERAVELGDRGWRDLLMRHQERMRALIARFGGREIDTAGDGFLVTFDGPARAIRCAVEASRAELAAGVPLRAGIHTGECEVLGAKLAGVGVHVGARVAALAGSGEVLVSRTVRDLVAGSGIALQSRGAHVLKGVPGEWEIFAAIQ